MEHSVSVIFSTYNKPDWLEKVLWGFESQRFRDFEIVIADDGSGDETRHLIEKFRNEGKLNILHVWHADKGYQKCQILNKAILKSSGDYLVFTDGDCIPREDFVEQHFKGKEAGCFLSGGAVRLPMDLSELISEQDVRSQRAFDLDWLLEKGLEKKFFKNLKLTKSEFTAKMMNRLTPAKATWNGGNSSGWKRDILEINGFDERMEYGGQDRELGERMINLGLKPKQLRFSAICIHLDHTRGYKTEDSIRKNKLIRKDTRRQKVTWTKHGIVKEMGARE